MEMRDGIKPTPISWIELRPVLGDLFAVPPDGRIPLAFDRSYLRGLKQYDILDNFLTRFSAINSELLRSQGFWFSIYDVDLWGGTAHYAPYHRHGPSGLEDVPPYAQGALYALMAEHERLAVSPTVMDVPNAGFLTSGSPTQGRLRMRDHNTQHWNRLICLTGISQLLQPQTSEECPGNSTLPPGWAAYHEMRIQSRGGALISKATDKIMRLFFLVRPTNKSPGLEMVEQAINWHLRCYQHQPYDDSLAETWRPIHFTWHAIVSPGQGDQPSYWPSGEFYLRRNLRVQKQAIALLYFPSTSGINMPPNSPRLLRICRSLLRGDDKFYWTILALLPPTPDFVADFPPGLDGICDCLKAKEPAFLILLTSGLQAAASHHIEVANMFDEEFGAEGLVIDPDAHDKLLVDDDDFSRSRKYFWAVSFLDLLMKQTNHIMQEMDAFFQHREKVLGDLWIAAQRKRQGPGKDYSVHYRSIWDRLIDEMKNPIDQLRLTLARFEASHKNILNLRDGVSLALSLPVKISWLISPAIQR